VNPYFWGPNLLLHDEVRFETDTNRNLRITFSPVQDAARYRKTQVRDWKAAKGLGQ